MCSSGSLPVTDDRPPRASAAALRHVRRWAVPVAGVVVLGMLLSHAHKVDWAGAWQALQRYPWALLGSVLAIALASHALYGCFDLIGRHHTRHRLPCWRTWAVAVTSYAFNLNLGSLIGGVGMRARLYARAGLSPGTVAQVVGISLATNWLGYGLLAGSLFAFGLIDPPEEVHLEAATFRLIGVGMVLLATGYVVACGLFRGRMWTVRGREVCLPAARVAVAQLALSSLNWSLMGAAMYVLLQGHVSYGMTLCVLMAASVVGVVTPIPAGLGVLEGVYLALLSDDVQQGTLMGAVLAYRALYYLTPLLLGVLSYLGLERYASAHPATAMVDVSGAARG